nr:retrovirus-related Pol polyprotein from transposon TNT 1-94 [Tanacetum cinerariifolium]
MQEELLQFKMQKVWVLVDLPHEKRAIGYTQEEGIDYEEVFAPVARIETIRLFLAYASFMGFMVYQLDVKSAFLDETIEEEVYVCQPLGFEDTNYPDKVSKVVKALYGLHQDLRACFCDANERQVSNEFNGRTHILFGSSKGKSASTLIDTKKPLLKDPDGEDVDVHSYKSMISSLMNLTSSRPDIMIAHDDKTKREAKGKSPVNFLTGYRNLSAEFEDFFDDSINEVNAAGSLVLAVGKISTNSTNTFSVAGPSNVVVKLEDITYSDDKDDVGAEARFNNLETTITVSPIPTTRVHKDHYVTQIICDLSSATQTRSMTRVAKDPGGLSQINNDDFHTCMLSAFFHKKNPRRAIGTKWVFRNKKDKRCIVVRNKARLVAQGHTQEEGINYKEVFSSVAKIEAIRLFLAYASFMGFMVYQMDVKSAFLYGTIEEEPLLKDPDGEDVDVHTYRSMIGSLMYLTSSRPDIILISWQCKKQTIVATSSTKAEYVAAAICCAQVLWIQNQLMDYGPSAPIIEDWVSDSEDESKTKPSQNVPSLVQPTKQVKSPRPSVQHVETSIPAANPKTASPKPKRQ